MPDAPTDARRRGTGRRGTGLGGIGLASAVAAVLTWLLHVLAGQVLGAEGYARFMVVWGVFFTLVGVLQGLQQEMTRSVAAVQPGSGVGARVMTGAVVTGLLGALVIVAAIPLWRAARPQDSVAVGLVLGLAWIAYAWGQSVNGVLAARRAWTTYAWAILLEGVLRAAAFAVAVVVSRSSPVLALGLCGGVVAWLVLSIRPEVRATWTARGDVSMPRLLGGATQAMAAAACSALLVSGFPVLLDLTSPQPLGASAGVLLAVLVATRAPLLLFLNAYQGPFITRLMTEGEPVGKVRRWSLLGLAVGVVAAAVGYAVGPPVVRLVFGAGFVAPRLLFPALVAATLAVGLLTVTGWAALARAQHRAYVTGWLLATGVGTLVLLLPVALEVRACLALVVGPLAGAATHLWSLSRRAG